MSSVPYSVEKVIEFCKTFDIQVVDRIDRKNQEFRENKNVSLLDEIEFIKHDLSVDHCSKAYIKDNDRKENYLYIFKALFVNSWCYIKLTIDEMYQTVRVISFHEDEEVKYEKY